MAAEFDPALHGARLRDLATVQFEMLGPELDVERIRVGFVGVNTSAPRVMQMSEGVMP